MKGNYGVLNIEISYKLYMKVAFIDDLVNIDYLNQLKNPFVTINGFFKVLNNTVIELDSFNTDLSHSTLCAKVFMENIKTKCELYFIHIIDNKTLKGSLESLLIALEWCYINEIEVINLSLGTTIVKEAALIKNVIDKISSRDILIVAATANTGLITYPAFFKNVIAVGAIKKKTNKFSDIYCKVKEEYITYNDLHTKISNQNSFATPQVTAMVCNLVNNSVSLPEIKAQLNLRFRYKKTLLNNYRMLKPQILILSNDKDKTVKNIESILNRFSENDYEGVCITDCLYTDYTKPIININEFKSYGFKNTIKLINNYMDIDIVILYLKNKHYKKINKDIDIIISDNPEFLHKWRCMYILLKDGIVTENEFKMILDILT